MPRFTKQALIDSFIELLNEKPFEKITVTDITDGCGVSRNTFYYYFEDIYALLDKLYSDEAMKLMNKAEASETWAEAFMRATAFARENRKAVYHIYKSVDHIRLEKYLDAVFYKEIIRLIEKECQKEGSRKLDDEEIRILAKFYAGATLGIFIGWLNNDMGYDLEKYIESLGSMLDKQMLSFLRDL